MDSRLRRWCNLTWADTHTHTLEHTQRQSLVNTPVDSTIAKSTLQRQREWCAGMRIRATIDVASLTSTLILWPASFFASTLAFHDAVIVLLLQHGKVSSNPTWVVGGEHVSWAEDVNQPFLPPGETGSFHQLDTKDSRRLGDDVHRTSQRWLFCSQSTSYGGNHPAFASLQWWVPKWKKIRLLDCPSFAQLKYILFQFCLSIFFHELHALCFAYDLFVTMLPCWIPRYPTADCWNLWGSGVYAYSEYLGPLGWITLGPLLGISSTSGGSPAIQALRFGFRQLLWCPSALLQ